MQSPTLRSSIRTLSSGSGQQIGSRRRENYCEERRRQLQQRFHTVTAARQRNNGNANDLHFRLHRTGEPTSATGSDRTTKTCTGNTRLYPYSIDSDRRSRIGRSLHAPISTGTTTQQGGITTRSGNTTHSRANITQAVPGNNQGISPRKRELLRGKLLRQNPKRSKEVQFLQDKVTSGEMNRNRAYLQSVQTDSSPNTNNMQSDVTKMLNNQLHEIRNSQTTDGLSQKQLDEINKQVETYKRLLISKVTGKPQLRNSHLTADENGDLTLEKRIVKNRQKIVANGKRFTLDELHQVLEERGQYSAEEINQIVQTYEQNSGTIHSDMFVTQVNHVFHPDSDVVGELKERLEEIHKKMFYPNKMWRVQVAFSKLLYSRTEQSAKLYAATLHGSDTSSLDKAMDVKSPSDIDKVITQLQQKDLSRELIRERDNSSFKGVMYTNAHIQISPRVSTHPVKGSSMVYKNCCASFPPYKKNDHTIVSHFSNGNSHVDFNDGLCLFRAIALYNNNVTQTRDVIVDDDFCNQVDELVYQYGEFRQEYISNALNVTPAIQIEVRDIELNGIGDNELPLVEDCFGLNIIILQKTEERKVSIFRDTCFRHGGVNKPVLYLDRYADHVSYIVNIEAYSGCYTCDNCDRTFTRLSLLKKHLKNRSGCGKDPQQKFPGGYYNRKLTVFEEAEQVLPSYKKPNDVFYPYLICFDYESFHEKTDQYDTIDEVIDSNLRDQNLSSGKTYFISTHRPLSVSVSSNVPGFDVGAKHFVANNGPEKLVQDKVHYMYLIQQKAYDLVWQKFGVQLYAQLTKYKDELQILSTELKTKSDKYDWKNSKLDDIQKVVQLTLSQHNRQIDNAREKDKQSRKSRVKARARKRKRKRPRNIRVSNPFINSDCEVDGDDDDDEEEEVDYQSCDEHDDNTSHVTSDNSWSERESDILSGLLSTSDSTASVQVPEPLPVLDNTKLSSYHPNLFDREIERIEKLIGRLYTWCKEIPVLSFNGGRFDLRLIRPYLHDILSKDIEDKPQSIHLINGTKGFMCISNGLLRFLDVINYVAPGTSLAKFLLQSTVSVSKGLYPYDWTTSLDILKRTSLPPKEQWFSVLKGQNILGKNDEEIEQNYLEMQQVWNDNNMCTMFDFLKWYNDLDVVPMKHACIEMAYQYQLKGIDMFKQTISTPGISLLLGIMHSERQGYRLPIINETNKDFHFMLRANIVGGPSIVFEREAIAGITKIRGTENIVQTVIGDDANSLYPNQCTKVMGVNAIYRRRASENFKAWRMDGMNHSSLEHEYFIWLNADRKNCGLPPVQCCSNNGGRPIIVAGVNVDGLAECITDESSLDPSELEIMKSTGSYQKQCKKTVYLVHGDWFHGHPDLIRSKYTQFLAETDANKRHRLTETLSMLLDRHYDTVYREQVLKAAGLNVIVMWETDWRKRTQLINFAHVDGGEMIKPYLVRKYGVQADKVTTEIILDELSRPLDHNNEGLFGLIECDIEVPERDIQSGLWNRLGPIFMNATVTEKDLTDYQLGLLSKLPNMPNNKDDINLSKRLLIDCCKVTGGGALFSTELLRWYLDHGLVITKIYQVFEFCAGNPFRSFVDEVVQERKNGDTARACVNCLDELLRINQTTYTEQHKKKLESKIEKYRSDISMAERSKVTLNSLYGKLLQNREKEEDCYFTTGYLSSCVAASKPGLKRHIQVHPRMDLYEIHRAKTRLINNTPLYQSIFILQHAKLDLLTYIYDYVFCYGSARKIMLMECDTDSAYCAYAGDGLRGCLKDESEYDRDEYGSYENFLLAFREAEERFTVKSSLDLRTVGKWKKEWEGKRLICLASKTYCGDNGSGDGVKCSAKGVQASLNKDILSVEVYKSVLHQSNTAGVQYAKYSGMRLGNNLMTDKGKMPGDNCEMLTYKGVKIAFTNSGLLKRALFSDGHTEPLKRAFTVEKIEYAK